VGTPNGIRVEVSEFLQSLLRHCRGARANQVDEHGTGALKDRFFEQCDNAIERFPVFESGTDAGCLGVNPV